MPRSIQEILDHADELAARFENYEPEPGDERPVEEYLLEREHSHEPEANDRSSTPSSRHEPRTCPGLASVSSSAPQPKQHSSATATSSPPADIARLTARSRAELLGFRQPEVGVDMRARLPSESDASIMQACRTS